MTWKPPRVGQDRAVPAHEAVQAAEPRDALGAGPQHQVIGVAEHDVGAGRRTWSGYSALTVPAVPTGMKAGVRISPRGVAISPRRAPPSVVVQREGEARRLIGSAAGRKEQAGVAVGIEAVAGARWRAR